jgi:hypothetical protein
VLEFKPSIRGVPIEEGGIDWVNVCGNVPLPGPPDLWWWESMGQRTVDSFVFEGDRFDLATMTTAPVADPAWFNIGCAGHTLAKLHLTRNTLASNAAPPSPSPSPTPSHAPTHEERQATLKMLVADYCGDGEPFTVAGQLLVWRGGLVDYFAPAATLEARWDEHGAVCLDTPRMANPTTQEGADEFPKIWAAIEERCDKAKIPPPCANPDPDDLAGALRISGNPF